MALLWRLCLTDSVSRGGRNGISRNLRISDVPGFWARGVREGIPKRERWAMRPSSATGFGSEVGNGSRVNKAVGRSCAEIIWPRGNHAAKEIEIGESRDDRSRSNGRSASLWLKRTANNVARIRFRATSMATWDSAILILRSAAVRPVRRSPKGEGGSIPRSAWICITAWCCSDVLRQAGRDDTAVFKNSGRKRRSTSVTVALTMRWGMART